LRAAGFGHVSFMTDDEAATGVAYEVHDAPSRDRDRDRDRDRERDDRDAEQEAMRLRRFRRMRAAVPVEPMC
jgi:hypothetical protein